MSSELSNEAAAPEESPKPPVVLALRKPNPKRASTRSQKSVPPSPEPPLSSAQSLRSATSVTPAAAGSQDIGWSTQPVFVTAADLEALQASSASPSAERIWSSKAPADLAATWRSFPPSEPADMIQAGRPPPMENGRSDVSAFLPSSWLARGSKEAPAVVPQATKPDPFAASLHLQPSVDPLPELTAAGLSSESEPVQDGHTMDSPRLGGLISLCTQI